MADLKGFEHHVDYNRYLSALEESEREMNEVLANLMEADIPTTGGSKGGSKSGSTSTGGTKAKSSGAAKNPQQFAMDSITGNNQTASDAENQKAQQQQTQQNQDSGNNQQQAQQQQQAAQKKGLWGRIKGVFQSIVKAVTNNGQKAVAEAASNMNKDYFKRNENLLHGANVLPQGTTWNGCIPPIALERCKSINIPRYVRGETEKVLDKGANAFIKTIFKDSKFKTVDPKKVPYATQFKSYFLGFTPDADPANYDKLVVADQQNGVINDNTNTRDAVYKFVMSIGNIRSDLERDINALNMIEQSIGSDIAYNTGKSFVKGDHVDANLTAELKSNTGELVAAADQWKSESGMLEVTLGKGNADGGGIQPDPDNGGTHFERGNDDYQKKLINEYRIYANICEAVTNARLTANLRIYKEYLDYLYAVIEANGGEAPPKPQPQQENPQPQQQAQA